MHYPICLTIYDNPEISRTTNALEGYFGRLKQKYRAHRGLSPAKRKIILAGVFTLNLFNFSNTK